MNNFNSTLNLSITEALQQINCNGYELDSLTPDGKVHRFGPKKTQWYIAFETQGGYTGQLGI